MVEGMPAPPKGRFIPVDYSLILMEPLPAGSILRLLGVTASGVRLEIDRADGREAWFDPDPITSTILLTSRAPSA